MKGITLLIVFLNCFGSIAQQADIVDFLKINAEIEAIPSEEKVKGTASFTFKVLKSTDSIFLDAKNMRVFNVALDYIKPVVTNDKIWLLHKFEANKTYTTLFSYETTPKQTLYFTKNQIWTQGQGKYTSYWLPSIDDMNDKIEFDLTIVAPPKSTVIANGKHLITAKKGNNNSWHWDMEKPMASYLVAFAVGDFQKKELKSVSGVPIELYYEPKDSVKVEPTYRYTKEIFDFLETEIGVPYPWQNYKQVPVRDFLYAGMENTTATIFSEAFIVDSIAFNDRNYVNVNAHELAHQWFGNMVTETEGTHHWLQEGFATFYALQAEKEIFGEDYYYWKLFQSAEQLKALSEDGKGESLLNAKASSLTFYEKGAWALHILKEKLGEEVFRTVIQSYLLKYAFRNVNTNDFLAEVRAISGKDFSKWEADWLMQSAFKAEDAYNSLLKSPFMNQYFEVAALRATPIEKKQIPLRTALSFPNDFIGQEAIYQLINEPLSETLPLYKKAFESNNLYVRQAISLSLEAIPKELQTEYESLLNDASYVTQESALYNLWVNFPEKQKEYLNKMRDVVGFQDKNVRQLWLVLALVTKEFEVENRERFASELKGYTSSDFSFEIRQLAFGYVNDLQMWDAITLKNLVNASVHYAWRFRNYARKLLDLVLKNEIFKIEILQLMNGFSEKEKKYIATKIAGE